MVQRFVDGLAKRVFLQHRHGQSSLAHGWQHDLRRHDHVRNVEAQSFEPGLGEGEGIGLPAGAWLGGLRSVLLMQSSGVGNLVNVLGMVKVCRFPLLMIVTMRGEAGEFNPWQVPVGQATARVLETMGVAVRQAGESQTVAAHVHAALRLAFQAQGAEAVLVAQQVIGIKSFQEQTDQ